MIDTTLISHIPPKTETYIGSPSITQLPSGELIVTHDYFGPGSGSDKSGVTEIYGSIDGGRSWQHRTTLHDAFWSSLFFHHNHLYLIGTNREHGELVIRQSADSINWTAPTVIAAGEWHTAPVPVVVWQGRIWRGVEDAEGGTIWPSRYRARHISASVTAHLLDPSVWTISAPYDRDELTTSGIIGCFEGNIIVNPVGKLALLLRIESTTKPNQAVLAYIDTHDATISKSQCIHMPGGTKKFTVRYDEITRRYLSLTNPVLTDAPAINPSHIRNTLALISSPDLTNWNVHTTLLTNSNITHHGYQYADWIIDGNDLLAVVRTAASYGEEMAHSFHDSNQMLFFRLKEFRKLLV